MSAAAGERPTVTAEDRRHAGAVVMEWSRELETPIPTRCQLELLGYVTSALADARARERTRLAGEPATEAQDVWVWLVVSRREWENPEGQARALQDVRGRWAADLQLHGLRPLTWPAVQTEGLAFGHALDQLWRPVPMDAPDLLNVRLTLRCDAVPA